MTELVRLSFSLEKPLHDRLEGLVQRLHYGNRSEFIRDMIRSRLVQEEWEGNQEAIQEIAGLLQQQKGVLHAAVSMSTTGKQLT